MQAVDWILNHPAVIAGLGVAVLDLVFALNPNANAADGALHWVYLQLKKMSSKTPEA